MSTVLTGITDSETGYDKRLHVKGASEYVLSTCNRYIDESGNKAELDDVKKQELNSIILDYAKQALRTIVFAYKDLNEGEGGSDHSEI
jgi:Ca2+-transporting ATPase